MARISGVNIPAQKHLVVALRSIYGVGNTTSLSICRDTGIEPSKKVKDLDDAELEKVRTRIGDLVVEGDLRRDVATSVKRLIDIGCYRGVRHKRGLPVHGQRTRTNARTRKGRKRAIAGKK